VKRSGRDESLWVAIHICMEAMLGISLDFYCYLKLAKMLCLSYYCFSSTKLEKAEQVLPGSEGRWAREGGGEGAGGEMAQTMYAQMNKLKNKLLKIR
jgi:hypothetical protein